MSLKQSKLNEIEGEIAEADKESADKTYRTTKKSVAIYYVITYVVMFGLSFAIAYLVDNKINKMNMSSIMKDEHKIVSMQEEFLKREFDIIISDTKYLYSAHKDLLNENNKYNLIGEKWAIFANERKIYDQIRYIDIKGMERIRVNHCDDCTKVVPDKDLQYKGDRYYFYDALKLGDGDIYISPLDLNIEGDKIEVPHKPMIRFSVPVYTDSGEEHGVLVLNFLARYTLDRFRILSEDSMGEVILLNSSGYSVSSDDPLNDWNFMFKNKKGDSFVKSNPEEWNSIMDGKNQFVTEEGLFTVVKVDLGQIYGKNDSDNVVYPSDGSWYIVSIIDKENSNYCYFDDSLLSVFKRIIKNNIWFFVAVGILATSIALVVTKERRTFNKIKYFSEFDTLTQSYNRRAGIARLANLALIESPKGNKISLCYIDINGLKLVNDNLGHQSGDELIVTVSSVVRGVIRESDFLIRLGGDEFLIVVRNADVQGAELVWQRISSKFNQINESEERDYIISVSHGIVEYERKDEHSIDELINIADEKMYEEKQEIKKDIQILR